MGPGFRQTPTLVFCLRRHPPVGDEQPDRKKWTEDVTGDGPTLFGAVLSCTVNCMMWPMASPR